MTNDRQAFIVSAVLHLGALGLVAAFVFIKPFQPQDQPVVLELVTLPEDVQSAAVAPPPPQLEQPPFEEFRDRPPPKAKMPKPPPEPSVEPPPKPKHEPKPETTKPEPPMPKMMSISDFKKNHGLPDQVQRPRPHSTTPPTIDPNRFVPKLESNLRIEPPTNAQSSLSTLIAQYQARLVEAIELRWDRPATSAGFEWAEVRFEVARDGTISNIRIIQHESPENFIASVRRALERTPGIGPRPDGWNGDMVITFRLR